MELVAHLRLSKQALIDLAFFCGVPGVLAILSAALGPYAAIMGAASSRTQGKDPVFEGQSVLRECRQLNSVAGIALGIHDFAQSRRNLTEIGIIHWDREIIEMFSLPKGTRIAQADQNAYRTYSDQIKLALQKGLAGETTTSTDLEGRGNNPQMLPTTPAPTPAPT